VNLAIDAVEVVGRAFHAKQLWLDWAEIFDSWRIVPRAIMFMIAHMVVSLDWTIVYWFIHLPNDHRAASDATAACALVGVFSTLFGVALKFYMDNGRQWGTPPATTTDTTVSTVVNK
jgi:hypothetical protein